MRRIVSRLRLAIKHELSASRGRRRVRYENHWVAEGVLHWEEMVEPFEAPVGEFLGHQTIYYTPKGEEWRIRAAGWYGRPDRIPELNRSLRGSVVIVARRNDPGVSA
jgi:hypothetical protein